ncbi:N(5),N(10)-methenyltetrahydromethanopterin cyclohydrolase [candidate division MSBL1 archaeon SCGC-AAA259D14]|uniref:Methenyltetrahydromethanopterin cyclohydrolase n=1 Tax=candidate division MSBL1 archaeon SCGC-AAA259D14 TaxID=1698261 RepID=A0A133U6Q5_9EURY|nr:N(5),N(10)-methenyltetrahydromethanopterin cyclohydrolase [candidate division MSBL1 archaeon SCGC-AAA259D14]
MVSVNKNAARIANRMIEEEEQLNINSFSLDNQAKVIDAGIETIGGYRAGKYFSEICLGDLGNVQFTMDKRPKVQVSVDHAVVSCMGSQYAGWSIKVGDYSAMGAGPARALSRVEDLFEEIGYEDESDVAVLTLESGEMPDEEVADYIAEKCGVDTENLYLIVAPTASIVGSVQVSSRVVETGIHKLHTLGFDINAVKSGCGSAPIAPVAGNDLEAMGKTNDCTLYGGRTIYFVETDDSEIEEVIEEVPSSASEDYGSPFLEIFERYDRDFFKIDRKLFSPAEITINNMKTGSVFHAGSVDEEVLKTSLEI